MTLFLPVWCWCWQTNAVARVLNVCHRHLRVCGGESWCVLSVMQLGGLTSHSHGFKQSLSMIDGAFSHHPEWLWGYVASNVCATCALCVFVPMTMCKSLSATGLWHSASLCHSQSVDAPRKKSCERRNRMSWFVKLAIPLSLVKWDLKRN